VPEPTPSPKPPVTETPTPTEMPPLETTPTPEPDVTPDAGQEEQDATEEDEKTITVQMVWYPTSVVSVDSVYAGTTDASGVLTAKLSYGTHVIELTRILLDGSTQPKKYTVDVNAQTAVINFLLKN